MAIDFTFPEEIRFLVDRVRRFCDEVVRPAEAEIAEREALAVLFVHERDGRLETTTTGGFERLRLRADPKGGGEPCCSSR